MMIITYYIINVEMEEIFMSEKKRYLKPNMTNLPPELGRAIFEEIRKAPKPDMETIQKKADVIRDNIRRAKENGTY